MRIAIFGAGAMGCLYGARLSASGHFITMIDVRQEVVDAVNERGIQLDGHGGPLQAGATAVNSTEASGPVDLFSVHAHADGSKQGAEVAARVLAPDGYAITFQNGIGNVEALVGSLGKDRVLGGISYNSAAGSSPGAARHTNPGITWIGELDGALSDRVRNLAETLEQAGFATTVSDNIVGVIWEKFIHNCAINPICALAGLMANEVSKVSEADEIQDRLLDELLAIVRAKGIQLVGDDPVAEIKETCRKTAVKPSMLQHVEAGQQTEIDSQNGAAVREGRALGIPTPYNEAVTLMVKARTSPSR